MRISKICNIACSLILFAILFSWCGNANAGDIKKYTTVLNTDFKIAGFGGIRDIGTGTINITGVSGQVNRAILYWHGPTNSSNPAANAVVSFNGSLIHGTNIGISSDNCWGYANSQAYRADVTSLVTGNGEYALDGFYKNVTENININGVSLVVLFDDGDSTNNYDVAIYDGNDSNMANSYDSLGWNITLNDIIYKTGSVYMDLNIGDGQNFDDGALIINGTTILPYGPIFNGNTVPNGASAATTNGGLWDIKSFDVTNFFTPGNNNLQFTIGSNSNDCLSMVVATVRMPAGSAPIMPPSSLVAKMTNPAVGTGIVLNWMDNSNNETGFVVERKNATSPWAAIATLQANLTTFTDSVASQNDNFVYRVQAVKNTDVSNYSNEAIAATNLPLSGTALGTIKLNWSVVSGAADYKVTWQEAKVNSVPLQAFTSNAQAIELTATNQVFPLKTYIVTVDAIDSNSNVIAHGFWKDIVKIASSSKPIVILVRGLWVDSLNKTKSKDVVEYFGAPATQPTYNDYLNGVATQQGKPGGLWQYLSDKGFYVFAADNIEGASTDYAANAYNLWSYIKNTAQIPEGTPINLIGHSMGGLISRQFIHGSYESYPVDNLITINTPHMGSTTAEEGRLVVLGLRKVVKELIKKAAASGTFYISGNPVAASVASDYIAELSDATLLQYIHDTFAYQTGLSTTDLDKFNKQIEPNSKVKYWAVGGIDPDAVAKSFPPIGKLTIAIAEERPDDWIVWNRSAYYLPNGKNKISNAEIWTYRLLKDNWAGGYLDFVTSFLSNKTVKQDIIDFTDKWKNGNYLETDHRILMLGNTIGNHLAINGNMFNEQEDRTPHIKMVEMLDLFVRPILEGKGPIKHDVSFSNNLWMEDNKYDPDTPYIQSTDGTFAPGVIVEDPDNLRNFWSKKALSAQAVSTDPPVLPSKLYIKSNIAGTVSVNQPIDLLALYVLNGVAINDGIVTAEVVLPDSTKESVTFTKDALNGVYKTTYLPKLVGKYDVILTANTASLTDEELASISFDVKGSTITIGEISDSGFDPDGNSRLDGIVINIPFNAFIAGTYKVSVNITDKNGVSVTNYSKSIVIDSTLTTTASILLSSEDIVKGNYVAPFKVTAITAWDSLNSIQYEGGNLYETTTSIDSIETDVPGYIKLNSFDITEANGILSVTSSATAASGLPLTYSWDFGDGTVLTGVNPTHSYARSGEFTLTLKISDSGGNTTTVTRYLNVVVPNTSLSLNKGWNLISFPITPANIASQTVLASALTNISSVWSYQNATWRMFLPNNVNFSDLTEITSGNAYWIESLVDTALPYNGISASKTMNLTLGWNFVGYNSASTQTVSTAIANIGVNLESVWGYTSGAWQMYDPANPGFSDLVNLEPGKGYWIKAKQASTWTLP